MSNVFDFPLPTGPITQAQVDTRHSQAFRDLESRLCECVSMAIIVRQLATSEADADPELLFAIGHAAEMLEALKVDYYAAFEDGKPIEP